jgi:FSR family fosmidomycin resistance protein-like MFS transporter
VPAAFTTLVLPGRREGRDPRCRPRSQRFADSRQRRGAHFVSARLVDIATGEDVAVGERSAAGDRPRLYLLALGHAVTDTYGHSLLAPMYPLLASRLQLTLGDVGGLVAMMGLTSSLAQPVWGYVSDRWPRLLLVALGPAVAALFCTGVGLATNYWTLAFCLVMTGLGLGAFHPQGAAMARRAGRGSGLAMSVFTVGGNIGYGLAPLLAAAYLAVLGMRHLSIAALPGLLVAVALTGVFRYRRPRHARHRDAPSSNGHLPAADGAALGFLTATVVLRSAVQIGMTTFLPFLVIQRFPHVRAAAAGGLVVSCFLLSSALSGPIGGHLSDRVGRKRIMIWSFLLAPWPLMLAFRLPGYWFLPGLALGGFLLMLPHPANVVMAQEFMPRSAGIAASMITGLAWGVAQLFAGPLGLAARHFGIEAALTGLGLLPILGAALVFPIPERTGTGRGRGCAAEGTSDALEA